MGIKTKAWRSIKKDLNKNFPKFVSTNGVFTNTVKYEIRDLDWNHMDGFHRPNIHDTYHESLKIAHDKSFQFTFTRIGLTPFIIPVFDLKIDEGKFYQTFSIFNLFTIISYTKLEKIKNSKVKQTIEWEILSHPWLKFMHKYISKKIYKLNKVQSNEDVVIRERRFNLRKLGFKFGTDNPNFVNSNDLSSKIIPPANNSYESISLELNDFEINKTKLIEINNIPLFVQRNNKNILIWPGICPHEGAELKRDYFKDQKLKCPWHNLSFSPLILSSSEPQLEILGLNLTLSDKTLTILNKNI